MLGDRPEDGEAILAKMVRLHELMLYSEDRCDLDGYLALVWKNGVIRAHGRLADGVSRDGDGIRVAHTIGTDVIGKPTPDVARLRTVGV